MEDPEEIIKQKGQYHKGSKNIYIIRKQFTTDLVQSIAKLFNAIKANMLPPLLFLSSNGCVANFILG